MKNGDTQKKVPPLWCAIIVCIVVMILALPIFAVIWIKDQFKNKKKDTPYHFDPNRGYDQPPLTYYRIPQQPLVDDKEFISRIDEFVCFQYNSFNGLSGRGHRFQFFASESPELKEYVLKFFQEHPIEALLCGDIHHRDCHDLDHWEIRFIFENEYLNRSIRGYGTTSASYPFLCKLIPYLSRAIIKPTGYDLWLERRETEFFLQKVEEQENNKEHPTEAE